MCLWNWTLRGVRSFISFRRLARPISTTLAQSIFAAPTSDKFWPVPDPQLSMTASPSNIEYGQIEPRDFAEAATINYRSFGTGSNPFSDAIEPLDTRPDYETRCKRAAIRMTRVFKSDKYLCMVARDTSKDGYVVGYAQWLKPGKPYEALDVSKLSEEEKEGFKGVSTDALEHMRVQMLNGREKVLGKDGQYWYLVL